MHTFRSHAAMAQAVVLLAGFLFCLPTPASAATPMPASTLPEPIQVPPGFTLLFTSHAKGVQTYECNNGKWAFRAPKAVLLDPQSRQVTGVHYGGIDRNRTAGPWWESLRDGSRIRGGNPVSAPSPNPNSIPLLRLEVLERNGTGTFSSVSYIQRLNTQGGVGPTGECRPGAQRWVPYTADYAFFGR